MACARAIMAGFFLGKASGGCHWKRALHQHLTKARMFSHSFMCLYIVMNAILVNNNNV